MNFQWLNHTAKLTKNTVRNDEEIEELLVEDGGVSSSLTSSSSIVDWLVWICWSATDNTTGCSTPLTVDNNI